MTAIQSTIATIPTTPAELFNGIADVFENNPEAWHQCDWGHRIVGECGTRGCIGGWAVMLRHGDAALVPYPCAIEGLLSMPDDWNADGSGPAPSGDGDLPLAQYAAQLLGLDREEALYLFDQEWTPNGYDGDTDSAAVVAALRAMANGAKPSEAGYHAV